MILKAKVKGALKTAKGDWIVAAGPFFEGGNRGNYPLQGRGFPMFFCFKELIFENFSRLRCQSATQAIFSFKF